MRKSCVVGLEVRYFQTTWISMCFTHRLMHQVQEDNLREWTQLHVHRPSLMTSLDDYFINFTDSICWVGQLMPWLGAE